MGTYYGDYYNDLTRKCEFRKCAAAGQCVDNLRIQYYDHILSEGKSEYRLRTRQQHCCDTDFCNSAAGRGLSWLLTIGVTLTAVLALSWEMAT